MTKQRVEEVKISKFVEETIVKPACWIFKDSYTNICDSVFVLHTKWTCLFLLAFAFLVSLHDLFGNPIHCILFDKNMKIFAENICWVNGTFTFRNVSEIIDGQETWQMIPEYQKYYQWIIVVLVLLGYTTYLPAIIWKCLERGRMNQLCGNLDSPVRQKYYEHQKARVVDYLKTDHSREHAFYAFKYVICEVFNFLIVVMNMLMLNGIFNQFWIRYLPAVSALFRTEGEEFSLLADEMFPKTAKCSFTYAGPSGSTQIRDALCLLSLNILNEKIFAFLYVWFIVLLLVSICNLVVRSILIVSSSLRSKLIWSLAYAHPLSRKDLKIILRGNAIGDWFVLYQLGRNLNPTAFGEILFDIANNNSMTKKTETFEPSDEKFQAITPTV